MTLRSCCPHPRQAWARPPKVDSGAGHVVRLRGRRMSRVPWNFGGGLVMSGGAHVLIIIAAVGDSFYSDMPV
jgi:hypothetical protein